MYNDILSIGPFTIHGYGLMIGIGIMVAIFYGEHRANKRGLNGDLIYGMTFAAVIFGFLSARLLFIITEFKDFLQNPAKYITGSGFVVFGGIIGGIITVYVYCKIKKVSFLDYFDLMIPCVALAQGFGRIGCFLAGCCYGRETTSPIGIIFRHSHYAPNNVKLMPTQLMMSAGDFVIAAILLQYAKKDHAKGRVGGLYLILYSVGRFCIEFFRNDDRGSVGTLSTSQFIGLFTAALGLVLYFIVFPKYEKRQQNTVTID